MSKHKHRKLSPIDQLNRLSYNQLFLLWAGMTLIFAVLYFGFSYIDGNGPTGFEGFDAHRRFWNSVYYSIITATSVGYGDIAPQGVSKIFAAAESMFGLGLFALFVTKLVSHRQDIALREVHKLTFEDIFHSMREDLYVIRKDFDTLMKKATEDHALKEEDWTRLTVAYRQFASWLQEIPDFYDGENNLYTIDTRREQLMQEAVHRTFHRINKMLDVFSDTDIDWISHDGSIGELRSLTRLAHQLIPMWREKSPYQKPEAFEQILHMTESIRRRLADELPVEASKHESEETPLKIKIIHTEKSPQRLAHTDSSEYE